MNSTKRLRQRYMLFYIGLAVLGVGCVTFFVAIGAALINLDLWNLTIIVWSMNMVGLGTVLFSVFAKVGWNSSPIIDFLFNQLSVLITVLGFIGLGFNFSFAGSTKFNPFWVLLIIMGLILAGLGMKWDQSPPNSLNDN